jgi:hypothetical protein
MRHFRDFLVWCHARRTQDSWSIEVEGRLSIGRRGVNSFFLRFVTAFAVQLKAYAALSAFLSQYPLAREERRVVAYVLLVSAVQLGHPVAFVVPVKSLDAPFQLASPSEIEFRSAAAKIERPPKPSQLRWPRSALVHSIKGEHANWSRTLSPSARRNNHNLVKAERWANIYRREKKRGFSPLKIYDEAAGV